MAGDYDTHGGVNVARLMIFVFVKLDYLLSSFFFNLNNIYRYNLTVISELNLLPKMLNRIIGFTITLHYFNFMVNAGRSLVELPIQLLDKFLN